MRAIVRHSTCCFPPPRRREAAGRAWLLTAALLLASGCGGPGQRPPLFWSQSVQPHDIGAVAVMAAADNRVDRRIAVDLDGQVRDATVALMRDRGWEATPMARPAAAHDLTLDDLADADATTIDRLATPGSCWVMVVGLADVSTALTLGSTGNADVAGYLFDTQERVLLWRDRGVGQVGQGSLLGWLAIGIMDEEAIKVAVRRMIAGLPPRVAPSGRGAPAPAQSS